MKNPFAIFGKSNEESDGNKYSLFKSSNRHNQTTLGTIQALDLHESSLYLNKGIAKRAEKVGETQFIIRNVKDNKVNTAHWLNKLLDKPNKTQTGDTFFKLASIYKDATGFVVIKKVKKDTPFRDRQDLVEELVILNSMGVTINYETNAEEKEYRIKSFSYADPESGLSEEIPFADCIYWYNPNPKKSLEGISILRSGLSSIIAEEEINTQQVSVLKNGGVVDGIFNFKNVLSAEQLGQLKKDYKKEYANSTHAGVPMFLGGEATYTRLGLNMQELAYVDSKGLLIKDIIAITGVPQSLLGLTGGETYANADASIRIFLRETIKPIVRDLVNVLDWRLAPDDVTIDFIDPTPEDEEAKLKKLEVGSNVNALTLNEKRAMLGLEPVTGGDDVVSENAPAQTKEKGILVHPLRNKDFRSLYYANYLKSLASKKATLKSELKKYFKEQEARIIANINATKSLKETKEFADELFNINLEISKAYSILETMKSIAEEAGQETLDTFTGGRDFNYSSSLDSAIDKRFTFLITKVNETTAKNISKEVKEWKDNSETTNELIERIKTVYGDVADYRLATIANTETANIAQTAKFEGYNQIGIKTKIWVWSPGIKGGVRDDHQSMDGEERPLGTPFSNGLMYPVESGGDAGDTINCECTI
jgi:HK97 family phage portal protein